MSEKLDIVVLGATGYTGKLTCNYLNKLKPGTCRWGIAGRSKEKLQALAKELKNDELPCFVVDLTKPETIDAVCKKTICVLSCAGPFSRVGMPVVEACVRQKSHYIDSTGEFTFVRLVAERFHDEAKAKGIAIVCSCAFDSVPSDLGNYVVHQEAKEPLTKVEAVFEIKSAGLSSGTLHTIAELPAHMKPEDVSPSSLVPKGAIQPVAAYSRRGMWYNRDVGKWTAPFNMAASNERIVRRTNALLGSSASYSESTGGGFSSMFALTVGSYVFKLSMAMPFLRKRIMEKFPKDVAHGPDEETKKSSMFTCTFVGTTKSGKKIVTVMSSKYDMYDISGVLLAECALCVCDLAKKNQIKPGVTTPAFAFGEQLLKRVQEIGLKISTNITNAN